MFLSLCFEREARSRPNALVLLEHDFVTTELATPRVSCGGGQATTMVLYGMHKGGEEACRRGGAQARAAGAHGEESCRE